VFSNKNLGIAVTAIAVVAGLMLGVAGPGRAQDKAADPKAPAKNWKDNNEYVEASAANTETDPTKKLADLDKWKKDYPSTEYIDDRNGLFMTTYQALKMARQTFDMALEVLKSNPKDINAIYATVTQVTQIKPAPTPADLDIAETNANLLIDNPDSVKPATLADAAWTQTKSQIKPVAEQVLVAIYAARKDDKRAVDDLRKLITRDPNYAFAAVNLGQTMIRIIAAAKTPEQQPAAFYQYARALAITGPGALAAAQVAPIQDYLKKAYTIYHGSAMGLEDLMSQAKSGPFPPAGFSIKSNVDIANEEEAARQAEIAKNPIMYLWATTIKGGLAMTGDAFFESLKDASLPGPDAADKSDPPAPRFFKASIISMEPATKPKTVTVGIEKADVADAKLTFEKPLDGKMDAGEMIEFFGTAKDWNHDQKSPVVTFAIEDPKTDLKGWTGKNTPGTKAAPPKGTVGTKGAAKGAPKQ
jgi:tetratricopeptide (TPR) repeat protein